MPYAEIRAASLCGFSPGAPPAEPPAPRPPRRPSLADGSRLPVVLAWGVEHRLSAALMSRLACLLWLL